MKAIDYEKRRKALAEEVGKAGFEAYLVTRQGGLHYLCGVFMPWRGVVLVTKHAAFTLFYWSGDASRVRLEGNHLDGLVEYDDNDLFDKIFDTLHSYGITGGKLAVDLSLKGTAQPAPGMLTASEYIELSKHREFEIVNGTKCLDDLLYIKDEAELERLERAASIADYGFSSVLSSIRPGMTENQVAGIIEHAIRDKGSYWAWSVTAGTEVGAGERSAFSHGVTQIASEHKLSGNEFVIVDFHPCYDLYLCDFSVPVFLGKPNEEQQALIDCWEEAVETVFDSMVPGVVISDAVAKGIDVYKKHGLYEYCLPRFGHGLGVCVRTAPSLKLNNKERFQPGMTFAFGAHLYKPGVGGLRLEYPIAVGKEKAYQLAKTPMKVHIVPIK